MATFWQDIRFGIRMLAKSGAFTAIALLTMAIGIGANTAIFSVVNAVLLRPLPFREPARLVTVLETKASQGLDWLYVTGANYVEWQHRQDVFETMAVSSGCGYRLPDDTEPRLLFGSCVSSTFFPMLGVKPILGRLWSAEEDQPGRGHVALLSYQTWKGQFGGDPNIVGRMIWRASDRANYTIIGVLPEEFQFARDDTAVWAPFELAPSLASERFHNYMVFARLRPGVTRDRAQQSMTVIASQLEKESPKFNTGWGVTVRPLQEHYASLGNTRTTLFVLLAAVGCLLLIACANIANLLLARSKIRQKEMAVRVALGASRLRLIRQLLTESILLGLLGGATGFLVAWAAFKSLLSIIPYIPSFEPHAIRIDGQVFASSLAASLLASIIFGLAPALRASKQDLNEALREARGGTRGTLRDSLARHLVVVSEIALAVILLTGTGLLIESLRNLEKDRLGFNPDHILLTGFCCLDEPHYAAQQQINAFYRQAFERIRALPGVEAASATSALPMRQFDGSGSPFLIQGRAVPDPGHDTLTDSRLIEPDYFRTMQITLLRGRVFTAQDDERHPLVAVINATMARRYFPDTDPIGQQIQLVNMRPSGRWFTVIGTVADSRDRGLGRETRCTVYVSDLQNMVRGTVLLIRTKAEPLATSGSVRSTLRSLNRDLFIGEANTLDGVISTSLAPQRFSVTLLTLFATLALSLASIGVYGVTAYTVAQRTHEIGIRIALGAQARDVLKLILGQGAGLALAGIALGLAGAMTLTRMMTTLLFGVNAHDPLTLVIVSGVLAAVALFACYIPARAAMRVDPMVSLRSE